MRPFPKSPLWRLIDWTGDKTALPERWVVPVASLQWGFGSVERPNPANLRLLTGPASDTGSLYQNGLLFARVALPCFIGLQIRWGGAAMRLAYLQTHAGWKLNGRLAIAFRVQSDTSAAAGMDAPNPGQAVGFADGGK